MSAHKAARKPASKKTRRVAATGAVRSSQGGKQRILVDTDEKRVVDEAVVALGNQEIAYQRGGILVHIVRELERPSEILRPPRTPQIAALPEPRLRELLADAANWVKPLEDSEGRGIKYPSCHVPSWAVKAVSARGEYERIRPLEGIVESPTLKADGTVLQSPGYDRASGLLYEPQISFPPIPERPSRSDIHAALAALQEPICDFPFRTPVYGAAWLAGLLTPLARYAFLGPSPLFVVDANTRGSGKTLLCDLISVVATGRTMARTTQPEDDEEFRKRVTSIALAGDNLVLIDNINKPLGCASLDAVLTGTSWKDRILGQSRMTAELPLVTTWFASGNNVMLQADTARRSLHVRLDSPDERPEERSGFRHSNLLSWVHQQRASLVAAALTVLRGYCAAGRPDQRLTSWGSFEGWSDMVRQALVWAGLPDPGETRQELASQVDVEAAALAALLLSLDERFPQGATAAEILSHLDDEPRSPLRGPLIELCPTAGGKLPSTRSLGNRLRGFRRRIVQGRCLDSRDSNSGAVWLVRKASDLQTERGSGDSQDSVWGVP